ncbi:MAG: glycosyltransferase family 2 protein [Fuerstiella sp.]
MPSEPAGPATADHAQPRCKLSVVVPAYNEAARIGAAIEDVICCVPPRVGTSWELLLVDDGSNDSTRAVVSKFQSRVPQLRLISHSANRGKGAAIRTGVRAAAGEVILFTDADGATPFGHATQLLDELEAGADIAVGIRISTAGIPRRRSLRRRLMAAVFRVLVSFLIHTPVRDTQCGFKMFRSSVARRLFGASQEEGYLFDVEILGLAHILCLRISEVSVSWQEVSGSRISVWRDSWRMFTGLWRVRRRLRLPPSAVAGSPDPASAQTEDLPLHVTSSLSN